MMLAIFRSGRPCWRALNNSPGPADAQVLLGDLEAVVGLRHDFEPALGGLVVRLGEQQAVGLGFAPPDAAAKLVQLGQAEAVGRLDDHDRRVGHIHAHLDHDGRDEDIDRALAKAGHDPLLLGRGHLAVQQGDLELGEDLLGQAPSSASVAAAISLLVSSTEEIRG